MKSNKITQKVSIAILCFLWIAVLAIGGTLAYLFTSTQQVINTFSVPSDGSSIVEEIEGNVKKKVVITNTGDVDSYIRARVIFTWQNEAGQVHPTAVVHPSEGVTGDYQITWNTGSAAGAWTERNGMYYYNGVVDAKASTAALFTNCTPVNPAPEEGYTLHVEILSQSVQAEGVAEDGNKAVEKAWGVDPSTL